MALKSKHWRIKTSFYWQKQANKKFLPPAARGRFLKKLPPGPLQKLLINMDKKNFAWHPFSSAWHLFPSVFFLLRVYRLFVIHISSY
jgi:hypothetical protein